VRLPAISDLSANIFERFIDSVVREGVLTESDVSVNPGNFEAYTSYRQEICDCLRNQMDPARFCGGTARDPGELLSKMEDSRTCLFVMCLLNSYLQFIYDWSEGADDEQADQRVHIVERSSPKDAGDNFDQWKKPNFNPEKAYAGLLMDVTAMRHFSVSPKARRDRFRVDTFAIKLLWDVTSRERFRALAMLVEMCCPKSAEEVAAEDGKNREF
jgi:hypothetical protein